MFKFKCEKTEDCPVDEENKDEIESMNPEDRPTYKVAFKVKIRAVDEKDLEQPIN